MRALLPFILVSLLVACGGDDGGGRGKHGPGGKGGFDRPEPVTVVSVDEARVGSVSQTLVSSAVVESEAMADLMPQTSGIVISVKKDEGDPVRRGEVLAVLENVSLDAGAERARNELAKVQKEVQELQTLFEKGAISQNELEEAHFRMQTAQSSAREAGATAGFTRITAPFDGVVAARDIRKGELASNAQRAFQVVDLDQLRVVASLPERDLAAVAMGQRAKLISAYDNDVWAWGSVTRLAPVVDATSGTFRVTVRVDPEQDTLRPGQFVSVELIVDEHVDVTVVDKAAVVYEDGSPVAYRMIPKPDDAEGDGDDTPGEADDEGAGGPGWFASLFGGDADPEAQADEAPEDDPQPEFVAERRSLKLGLVDGKHAEVLGGVELGDKVITVGQSNLRDGAPVRTPEMQREAAERAEARKKAQAKQSEGEGAEG